MSRPERVKQVSAEMEGSGATPLPSWLSAYGEGGIRTRDTTIFSRVLYQLSYLASAREPLAHGEG
jgi:hypothetical protein